MVCRVWSLDLTSLAHSLLFVTCHPLVFVVGYFLVGVAVCCVWLVGWLVRFDDLAPQVSWIEVVGVLVGFGGAALTAADVTNDSEVTFVGDMLAFFGALAMVVYMQCGQTLRAWMPLFMCEYIYLSYFWFVRIHVSLFFCRYAFPVTFGASLWLVGHERVGFVFSNLSRSLQLIGSAVSEPMTFRGLGSESVFGFLNPTWLPYTIWLVVFPGMLGHTGINAVLRKLSGLIVSVSLTMEPFFGTFIGLWFDEASEPKLFTLIGKTVTDSCFF